MSTRLLSGVLRIVLRKTVIFGSYDSPFFLTERLAYYLEVQELTCKREDEQHTSRMAKKEAFKVEPNGLAVSINPK